MQFRFLKILFWLISDNNKLVKRLYFDSFDDNYEFFVIEILKNSIIIIKNATTGVFIIDFKSNNSKNKFLRFLHYFL